MRKADIETGQSANQNFSVTNSSAWTERKPSYIQVPMGKQVRYKSVRPAKNPFTFFGEFINVSLIVLVAQKIIIVSVGFTVSKGN